MLFGKKARTAAVCTPDISALSLTSPAPAVDYSSDDDSVIIIGHIEKGKHRDFIDLTEEDEVTASDLEEYHSDPTHESTWIHGGTTRWWTRWYALQRATISGNLPEVKYIFDTETNAAELQLLIDRAMCEQMQQAIVHDYADIVAYLLTHDDTFQAHHIETAIRFKAYKALQVFLETNWDINRHRKELGHPPFLSTVLDDRRMTQWFLDHGADPNAACKFDITPLSLAVKYAPFDIIELLFQHGHGGSTSKGQLLHYAAWRYKPDCVDVANFLVREGCDINGMKFATDPAAQKALGGSKFCGSPLAEAARAGHVAMVQFFLENGADVWIDQMQYQAWSPHAWAQFNVMKEPNSKAYSVVLDMLVQRMYGDSQGTLVEAGYQHEVLLLD